MLQLDETRVIDTILGSVEEGLKAVEDHPHLNSHEASLNAGSPVTSLTNRFRITSDVVAALRVRLAENQDEEKVAFVQNLTDDCTEEDARAMVDMYFQAFPTLWQSYINQAQPRA